MPSDAELLLQQAAAWQAQGRRVALATVVKTWGSSPRPAGSWLVVNDRSEFVGSVSGGCIEGAVIGAAQEAIADGQPRLLEFGVTHDMAWEVGLACGGQVQVFVQALPAAGSLTQVISDLLHAVTQRKPMVLLTSIPDGAVELSGEDSTHSADAVRQAIREALASDRPVEVGSSAAPDSAPGRLFVQPFCPAARLIIVGAVHIAQPLSQLAALAGLEVVLIDPRTAFATEARFPGVSRKTTWPAQALAEVGVDRRTAVVTLTHDPKLDDPALEAALRSQAFYVGSLGSGKTHAARLGRLRSRGFSDEQLGRIHGPVGLKIGARSPAEIAVSILAELIAELRKDAA